MKDIIVLLEQCTHRKVVKVEELPSSGSNRRYFRLFLEQGESATVGNLDVDRWVERLDGCDSVIGVKGTSAEENRAFWAIARHFREKGLPVPEVYAHNEKFTCYIQEDLGNANLFDTLSSGRDAGQYDDLQKKLLCDTISMLPSLQFEGAQGLDFSVCYPQPEFDFRMISFDLNYFKYCFLKATGIEFNEIRLDDDFHHLSQVLLQDQSNTFLYRDFQARNVMLVNERPYFIDFQGGRRGPIYYDVASFIWQAKANYSKELKELLVGCYLKSLGRYMSVSEDAFRARLRHFVLFRTLQVLGAYGFRGYFEKKPHFLQSVPYAIDNLRHLLKTPFEEYPYLSGLLTELTQMRQFSEMGASRKLEVRIFSFAYKKGIPNDTSGNGGGYVFDCRAINNPGKYEHFFHFNGMDREVVDFLEEDGGVFGFLDNVYALADKHVQRYIERKFTNLMFSFGCTGGQHRSVYCAERLAEHIAAKFDVNVILYHREMDVEKRL